MKKKPSAAQLIAEIDAKKGNISAIARTYGVSRGTVYNWMRGKATVEAALTDARETMIDNAESMLYKKVLQGSTPELIFFLKTQGRKRGYVERQEVTGKDGGPIESKNIGMTLEEFRAEQAAKRSEAESLLAAFAEAEADDPEMDRGAESE